MKPPAFQFYPDDFIGGTVDLSAEQCGGYIRLLCYQWGAGRIPETKEAQDRVAGCSVCEQVLSKFPRGKNKRLELERRKQAEYRAKQSLKGQASAKARFNRGSTVVQPSVVGFRFQPNGNSPSPSPSPNGEVQPPRSSDVSPSVQLIRDTQELERVEKAIKEIRSSYSEHQSMSEADRERIAPLKARRKELMGILGFKA